MLRRFTHSISVLSCVLTVATPCALAALPTVAAGADAPALQIHLGKTIERTLAQSTKDNYAWGPKQSYDSGKRETQIFLPYGNHPLLSSSAKNAILSDATKDSFAELYTNDSHRSLDVVYRLEFDKPISAFRAAIGGYTELVLAPGCAAGVEYSLDGTAWAALGEPQKGTHAVVQGLVKADTVVTGIDTRLLLLRIYTRDLDHPDAAEGGGQYLKMRVSGDPSWGDAAKTFAKAQNQVWVMPRK